MQFAVVRATTVATVSTSAAVLAETFLWRMLMTRIKNGAMAALVALGIAAVGAFALEPQGDKSPSAGDAKQELLDLIHAWGKALVQSDVGTMDRLLADETICTDPGGGVWDKSQYLEFVRVDYWHIESYEVKDTKVHVYGDAAVVTGLFLTNVNSKRRPRVVERYTKTWIRRHGIWQCVAWQTMVIEAGQHGSDARHQHPASASPRRRDRDSVPND
jgi:hypothetical protein